MKKKYAFLIALLLLVNIPLMCYEKMFKYAPGEYDLNGIKILQLLYLVSPSDEMFDALWDLNNAQYTCRAGRSAADCRLEVLAKSSGSAWVRKLNERVMMSSSSVEWEQYLTGQFMDKNGNTLLHKMAQECETLTEDDCYAFIKALDKASGPNYTLPYSFDNALSDDSVFMLGSKFENGGYISALVRNNDQKTARDIVNQKIEGQGFFSSTPSSLKALQKYLQDQEQREIDEKNLMKFVKTGKGS